MARVRTAVVIGLVATGTSTWRIGIIAVVTSFAIVGNRNMRAGERINGAVVKRRRNPGAFTMATFTARRELGCSVVRVGSRIVIANVAACTSIRRVGVIAVVACCTIIGNRNMRPIQNIIIVVDREGCRIPPGVSGVAHRAIRWQPQRYVARVCTGIVIGLVATRTSVRSSSIIAVMASFAIVGDWDMRADERINSTVVKSRRRPGAFTMATFAVRGELSSGMVGVGGCIVIAQMAAHAGIRGIGVIAVVAGIAVVGNRDMRPVERIECTVVKRGRRPVAFRMTIRTGGGELGSNVVRIGRRSVVCLMAPCAGIERVVVIAVVASRTIVGNGCMRPVQRIIVVVDGEGRRIPPRVRCMAHRAVRRQT